MAEKVSLTQPQPSDEVVPTELVPLPSEGVVYPVDSPLFGRKAVEIRSMTAHDEDILTSRALLKSGRALSMLLRGCIVGAHVDPDQMLSGDRNAALIGIRITGYGPEYKVGMVCPSCGERVEHEVNLAALPIKRFPKDVKPVEAGKNEFAFTLPTSKRKITFKLLTAADEQEIIQTVERSRKAGLQEAVITTRLKVQILSIDGERDPAKLGRLVEFMPAKDSRELRSHIDKISPGIELKTDFTCSACGEAQEVEVPLGTEFFWPTT